MSGPTHIRVYRSGERVPLASGFFESGTGVSLVLPLESGAHSLEVTAHAEGSTESVRTPLSVSVTRGAAPVVSSPLDWSEVDAASVSVRVTGESAGTTIIVMRDGTVISSQVHSGGDAVVSVPLRSSGRYTQLLDVVETITVIAVRSGTPSAPAVRRIVPIVGRVKGKGARTIRALHMVDLLSYNRATVGGPWAGETAYGMTRWRNTYRAGYGSGESNSLTYEVQPSFHYDEWNSPVSAVIGGMAPGLYDAPAVRAFLARYLGGVAGTGAQHIKLDGTTIDARMPQLQYATMVALAYWRGDTGVLAEHRSRLIALLSDPPIDINGNVQGQPEGVDCFDVSSGPITHVNATAWWYHGLRQLRDVATAESDSVLASYIDTVMGRLRSGLAYYTGTHGLLMDSLPFYNEDTERMDGGGPCPASTALAALAQGFSSQEQADAIAALLLNTQRPASSTGVWRANSCSSCSASARPLRARCWRTTRAGR
jgi:hypothetical protein